MKNLYKQTYILLMLIITLSIISCTDDSLIDNYGTENNELVELKLNFTATVPEQAISSRAPHDNTVNDLYVFIFNASNGGLRAKRYYSLQELKNGTDGLQPSITEENNWVKIETTTGNSIIYGIANIDGSVNHYENTLKESLDNIETLDELLALSINITSGLDRNGNTYLMAGSVNNGEPYTITKGLDIRIIRLKRLDSVITFNFAIGQNSNCDRFVLESYEVHNVPNKTFVTEHTATSQAKLEAEWDAAKTKDDFFKTPTITGMLDTEKSFTFYMPENRKNRKKDAVGTTPKELYACREKQIKQQIESATQRPTIQNGAYEYAPDFGTYVVVNGKFYGQSTYYQNDIHKKNDYSGEVEASVRYVIHLGYVNHQANDYFTNRNTKYTYNVTINGVDDIVVEVVEETETEKAPGAEGDVLFVNGTTKYNLDAHYETVLLRFNRSLLQAGKDKSDFFSYKVETPYTRNYKVSDQDDINWIRIIRNDKNNNKYSEDFKPYPKEGYMTIAKLIKELQEAASDTNSELFDTNGEIVYTCHIDEFYYEKAPTGANVSGDLWKTFVNQPNRVLQILSNVELSPDGKSSITRSTYVISQRSIQTFYNTNLKESYSAYGVETVNETGPLSTWDNYQSQIAYYSTDKDNGLNNYKNIVNKLTTSSRTNPTMWTTYLNWDINGYKKSNIPISPTIVAMIDNGTERVQTGRYWGRPQYTTYDNNYQRAYLACMQRNRDTNSDGIIDNDEIKWYLPAINQYAGMFLGDAGLSEEAKLYTENTYVYKHFISSTANSTNNSNLIVYWAEESVSTSCNTEYDMVTKIDGTLVNHYRCMRNLGDGTPKTYYDATEDDRITVPYLNTNSLRKNPIVQDELGWHTNWENESRIGSQGFIIGGNTNTEDLNIGDVIGHPNAVNKDPKTPCYYLTPGNGHYRAPNLRELYLMYAGGKIIDGDAVSRTLFNFYDQNIPAKGGNPGTDDENRIGWYFNGTNITMGQGSLEQGSYIRCVRDIQTN